MKHSPWAMIDKYLIEIAAKSIRQLSIRECEGLYTYICIFEKKTYISLAHFTRVSSFIWQT